MRLTPIEKRIVLLSILGAFILFGLIFENHYKTSHVEGNEPEKIVETKNVEFPIDINKASVEELVELPGIGPVKARAIVEYRQKNGPFASVEDLINVSGIGEKTLERIKDLVKVEGSGKVLNENLKVNVNEADLEDLMKLPGIGKVKAKRIIENRPYSKPEDLLKVPGIGEKTLEKIKDMISF